MNWRVSIPIKSTPFFGLGRTIHARQKRFCAYELPADFYKKKTLSLDELEKSSRKNREEVIEMLCRDFNVKYVDRLMPTRSSIDGSCLDEINFVLNKRFAIHSEGAKEKNVLVTSNLFDLLETTFLKSGFSLGFTSRAVYENYLTDLAKFQEQIVANRAQGLPWLNFLSLCLLDADVHGAKEVHFGFPEMGRYQFLAQGKEYTGEIDKRITENLVELLTKPLLTNSSLGDVYPLGKVKAHIINRSPSPGVLISFLNRSLNDQVVEFSKPTKERANFKAVSSHILLIDDDVRFTKLLRKGIAAKGYMVSIAVSANDALLYHLNSDSAIDLVVTDLHMPQITGLDLIKTIKAMRPGLPIIVLTSDSTSSSYGDVLKAGGDVVVYKEDNSKLLMSWISRLIERRKIVLNS